MSLKLQKESIKLNEVISAQYGKTMVESDIIVPDVKPDILKILHVDAAASITQKNVQQDKVVIQGNIMLNILYIPDSDVSGRVKSMTNTQMFTHVSDAVGVRPNMSLFCEAEVEDIESSYINSRKMNVRATVGVNIKVFNSMDIEIANDMQASDKLQTKGEIIRACNMVFEGEKEIILREQIEVPATKAPIADLLKIDAKVNERELMMVENKVVVKGDVDINILYSSVDFVKNEGEEFDKEVETINFTEHQPQFNEVLSIDGIKESMEGEIDYSVKEIYFDINEDMAGDRRLVNIEITICASVHVCETLEINSIEDAYTIDGEIEIKKGMYNIEQMIGKSATQISHRDLAEISADMPSISQIVNCKAKPMVNGIKVENGKAFVEGVIDTHIMYLTADNENPVCAIAHKSDFTQAIEIAGMEDKVMCEAKLEVEHLSFNMTTDREVELRFVIGFEVKAVKAAKTEIIEEIFWMEEVKIDPRPSIVIYFVQSGDTLWDIAKRYKTTVASIIKNNNLESDLLNIGQQLMI